jgi:hypothetical protein
MRYYIFSFKEDDKGIRLMHELSGIPNGYAFENSPIHVNTKRNVWVTYPSSKNIDFINYSIKFLKATNSVEIIPTNITDEIKVPENVKSRNDIDFNLKMVNIFGSFAPNIDLT